MYGTEAAHIDPGTLRSLQAAMPDAIAPTTTLRLIDAVFALNGLDPNVNQFAANFILMRRVICNVPDAKHFIHIIFTIMTGWVFQKIFLCMGQFAIIETHTAARAPRPVLMGTLRRCGWAYRTNARCHAQDGRRFQLPKFYIATA